MASDWAPAGKERSPATAGPQGAVARLGQIGLITMPRRNRTCTSLPRPLWMPFLTGSSGRGKLRIAPKRAKSRHPCGRTSLVCNRVGYQRTHDRRSGTAITPASTRHGTHRLNHGKQVALVQELWIQLSFRHLAPGLLSLSPASKLSTSHLRIPLRALYRRFRHQYTPCVMVLP